MARKPCAQDVPQLTFDKTNCGCHDRSGRFNRIARNAILPFYYDCSNISDPQNNLDKCRKVFYIKNPKFFAGAAANNPGSRVTQTMRFADLARNTSRTVGGRRTTQIITPGGECLQYGKSIVWYGGFIEVLNNSVSTSRACKCSRNVSEVLTNN